MCSTARQANIDWIAFHHVPSAQWKQEGRLGATLLQLHAQNCTISWTGAQQEMMPTICIDSGNREHLPTAKWWTSVLNSRGNWAVLNTSRKRRVALIHHGFVRETPPHLRNLSQHHACSKLKRGTWHSVFLWKHESGVAALFHSSDLSQTTQVWQLSHSS